MRHCGKEKKKYLWVIALMLVLSLMCPTAAVAVDADTAERGSGEGEAVQAESALTPDESKSGESNSDAPEDHAASEPAPDEPEKLIPSEPAPDEPNSGARVSDELNSGAPEAGSFNIPEVVLYNFAGAQINAMLKYERGPSQGNWTESFDYPNGSAPGEVFPIADFRITEISLTEQKDSDPKWYRSPYYQDDFKQIKVRYTADDSGNIDVEKVSGDGSVEYDPANNIIKVHLVSEELVLAEPRLVNSDSDRTFLQDNMAFRPHVFSFTPQESGKYSFFSSDNQNNVDVTGAILDDSGNVLVYDNNSGGNNNFAISRYYMEAGRTYYFASSRENENARGDYNVTLTKEPEPEAFDIEEKAEGYLTLHVKKEWDDDKKTHEAITVFLSPAAGAQDSLTLSEENGWEGVFEDLPLYDESGEEIRYSVTESETEGYNPSYGQIEELDRQTYWVMVDAPGELESGRKYILAAQDWGQAMYFNNPHTYYFLKDPDDGPQGRIGMRRIEHTDTVFVGPKTGDGTEAIVLGGRSYDEYLNNESEAVQNIGEGEIWILRAQDEDWVLQNSLLSQLMTLKGDNQWWNFWNPHVYSYIVSNEDGWHGDINVNYSHALEISPANDGMARIASTQYWGNNLYEKQYLYLNLTAYDQTTGATGEYYAAGQFKFFTPITEVEQSVTITNRPPGEVYVPVTDTEKPKTPETGDDGHIMFYLLMLVFSMLLAVSIVIVRAKKR